MKFLMLALVIGTGFLSGFGQHSEEPNITSSIGFEKERNPEIEKALFEAYDLNETDDKATRYYYNFVDLNGDGINEVLVYIFGGKFCGTGGCDAVLFREVNGKYHVVNYFEPVRNPIFISSKKTNGWKDIIFFNNGGGINPGYYSVAKFDGRRYHNNPTILKSAPPLKSRVQATAVLVGQGYGDTSLAFKF